MVPNLDHYTQKKLTLLPPLASMVSCHLNHLQCKEPNILLLVETRMSKLSQEFT
jgi:hypothetical protein